jgi:hypothetical protein
MVKELRIKKRQEPDGELTKYKGCLESQILKDRREI